jgi:phenylpyruvate tautomerase PptA (4-oxalocrotonate tautomerase family)
MKRIDAYANRDDLLVAGSDGPPKKKVIEQVTEALVSEGGARREDVLVIFQDILPGDFGRGGQVANAPAQFSGDDLTGSGGNESHG